MRFLCIGYGSIGKRHCSILREMGHEITTVDPNPAAEADYYWSRTGILISHLDGKEMRERDTHLDQFAGVLDCSPLDARPSWRIWSMPHFVEKPLGPNAPERTDYPVMLGFCYRWAPSLQAFRDSLAGVRVYSLTMLAGSWLPDWHDADYRTRYHGTPGRGGVVLDSLSHSLYIARWLMGELDLVGSVTEHLSGLDIATEDVAGALLRAKTGQPVYVYADYLRKPGESWAEAVTSGGVKRWEFPEEDVEPMYRRQMEKFVEVCGWGRTYGFPNLRDGTAVQRILGEVLNERP